MEKPCGAAISRPRGEGPCPHTAQGRACGQWSLQNRTCRNVSGPQRTLSTSPDVCPAWTSGQFSGTGACGPRDAWWGSGQPRGAHLQSGRSCFQNPASWSWACPHTWQNPLCPGPSVPAATVLRCSPNTASSFLPQDLCTGGSPCLVFIAVTFAWLAP